MKHQDDQFADPSSIETLRAIMRALRTPSTGCPWDLEQTFSTIAPYTIEEAYEVADAVDRDDMADLKDELGDLLLQVVFHAQMAEESGFFTFNDIVAAIGSKLIRRHPHVFGDEQARTSGAVIGMWERIKAEERAEKTDQTDSGQSVLGDVPLGLPALMRASKLQKCAARVGFDWASAEPVFDKVAEELQELRLAAVSKNVEAIADEIGDLLFAMANLARHLGVEPEESLRRTNSKFINRFRYIEKHLEQSYKNIEDASLDEMDSLWNEAKAQER